MVLKVKTDVRIFLSKLNITIIVYILFYSIIYLYRHGQINLPALTVFFVSTIITSVLNFFPAKRFYLKNSYLYLKNSRKEPNSMEDIPIKPQDISGYSLNNPFPKLSKWCDSSKNITLFLNNGKHIVFSAKDQEAVFIKWLKENFIREENNYPKRGIIETFFYTLLSLLLFLFYLYLYKTDSLSNSDFLYLITTGACFAYNLFFIISGIVLSSIWKLRKSDF